MHESLASANTIDVTVVSLDSRSGALRGVLTNRSHTAWHRDEKPAELRIGLRILTPGSPHAVAEGRGLLPCVVCPNASVEYEIKYDPTLVPPGRYTIEIDLLREGYFWLSQPGDKPHCCDLVITPERAPHTRRGQVFGVDPDHPYRGLPSEAFWESGVCAPGLNTDPVTSTRFIIGPNERVASAGSCFAQHISRYLKRTGFRFFQTEDASTDATFSANFGNIYTAHQLHQLLRRAYGVLHPADIAWQRSDGRFIDPFRPQLFPAGFPDEDHVCEARDAHLLCVRRMFEESDVFVFTLGLTEGWVNAEDGVALPIPPGVVASRAGIGPYTFVNYNPNLIEAELNAFIANVRLVNSRLKVILTVSPVPLIATFMGKHVLQSNTYSKAALRVAAEAVEAANSDVTYFPSYEIITSLASRGSFFEADLRSVTVKGVDAVMAVFARHYLNTSAEAATAPADLEEPRQAIQQDWQEQRAALSAVVCDELLLGQLG